MNINRQYVVKDQEIYAGLEDSKKTWVISVRAQGTIVSETTMPAEYDALRNYFRNNFPGCKINVIYEAGFRGFGLYDKITADGWECVVTPPHTVTDEKCQRQKNDRVDCRRLAKNLENGDYKSCDVPDQKRREDRQISRLYSQVQRDITRNSNRIRRTLEFHGLDGLFRSGVWSQRDYGKAKETINSMDISLSLRLTFNMMFDMLENLREHRKELRRALMVISKEERYRKKFEIIKSVPGIGPLTAIRLFLEWGDVARFKRKEEFGNFTGLIPRDYSTGERDHKGHITKQGCRWVRGWLIECAWVAIRYDRVLLEKFMNVYKSNGSKKKAIVAVARKMAIRVRAILISGEMYSKGMIQ
jgi:transposase